MRAFFMVALTIGATLLIRGYWGVTVNCHSRNVRASVEPESEYPTNEAVRMGFKGEIQTIATAPPKDPSLARVHKRLDLKPKLKSQIGSRPAPTHAGADACQDLLSKVVTSHKKAFKVLRPCPSPLVGALMGYLDRLPSANTTHIHRWERLQVDLVRVHDLVHVSTIATPGAAAVVFGAYSDAEGPHLRAVPISVKNRDDILEQSLPYMECPEVAGPVDPNDVTDYINFNHLAVTLSRRVPIHESNTIICGGTLLDWHRHCGMGINTDDIDYCILDAINSTTLRKKYIDPAIGHPIKLLHEYPPMDHCRIRHVPPLDSALDDCSSTTAGGEIVLGVGNNVRADYFVFGTYSPLNDIVWWDLLWKNESHARIQCFPASSVAYALFNGQILVKVPVKSALWHQWNFGPAWQMDTIDGKKVEWDWWESPQNLCGEVFRDESGDIEMHWNVEKIAKMLRLTV